MLVTTLALLLAMSSPQAPSLLPDSTGFRETGSFGPKVMLINEYAGSGGDALPWMFRRLGTGPLVGTRTWGGLIGISGAPTLVDGGSVTVPTFRMFSPQGTWFAEGHGVDPDILVNENPTDLARGRDPQLQRAIDEVTQAVAKMPAAPARPAYEKRIGGGGN